MHSPLYIVYTVLIPNLLRANFNFKTCVDVGIPSMKLHTGKYFQEKSHDHKHDVIYRSQVVEVE